MTKGNKADSNSVFIGIVLVLIAGIVFVTGVIWQNFLDYTKDVSDLPDMLSGLSDTSAFVDLEDEKAIVFSFVVPRGDMVSFLKIVRPSLEEVVSPAERNLIIDISSNESEVIEKVERGEAHYGSVSATMYVANRNRRNIRAVLQRYSEPPKRAVFLVRRNDSAREFADLKNYVVALKPSEAILEYTIPLKEKMGKDFIPSDFFSQEFYSDNYSDLILGLLNHNYGVIVVASNFLDEQPESIINSVRPIFESDPLPGGLYIASKDRREPFEQIVTGHFMRRSLEIEPARMFEGLFKVKRPDRAAFRRLEELLEK